MDQQPPVTTQNNAPMPEMQPQPEHGSLGPLIGVIVIIALLIFGGLYFWGAQLDDADSDAVPYIPDEVGFMAEPVNNNSDLSSSDTVVDIEADLDNTDLAEIESAINADIESLEAELGGLEF